MKNVKITLSGDDIIIEKAINELINVMNVYVLDRTDEVGYDEHVEQTIVANNKENALLLANKKYGEWKISKIVDLTKEQVLTTSFNNG